jgi:hypothetical protein
MNVVVARSSEDAIVIRFGGESARVNAYTLATTIVALADAAKAANSQLNPGYDIEILIEALSQGSFKTKIKAIYRKAGNIFSGNDVRAIVLSVISAYIYTHTLEPSQDVSVVVNTNEVLIRQGDKTIVVPREIHEATKEVERVPNFLPGVARVFQAVEEDSDVNYLEVASSLLDESVAERIPRQKFPRLAAISSSNDPDTRELIENTEVMITRAILERGRKRWQFVWRGVRISAPVLDKRFYERFAAHEITIAPGDALRVRLRIRQRRDSDVGIFVNDPEGYEVIEVIEHRARGKKATRF